MTEKKARVAVAGATGLFLTDLPITPEKVLLALKGKEKS